MFDELKRRAQEKRKKNPPAKTAADVSVENRNAEQLMPYVYNQIARAEEMKPSWTTTLPARLVAVTPK